MGYPPMTDAVDDRTIAYDVGGSVMNINNTHNENDDNVFHPDDMKFHTSWDWLMPVIENIDHLQYARVKGIEDALSTRHIGDTHKAVVEFIKEYNNDTI